ncbi:BKACE family enzyme [Dongia rigui]|uniref:3-keto-5-aminohexanoate cleavage protein n=1 Tax=Dongia rigui TaxID=940149 RepID=A0ABU5E1R0_9PROT|nr:3-keto-5-aminohexanoate cleavage protein [Dongia rigui]MDY0873539.1 3-keto-5-aminohexanoate cleavage protein [Dongia rigui]
MANAEIAKKPKGRKVIITCAVTGSVHTPTMTPYLPITPDEIATESIAAAEAGASVIHLHARDPKDGRPTPNPDVFMQFLPRIKQNTDAVINITTGGSLGMSMDDRLAAPLRAKPELCSLNMGSMNFGIFHAGDKITDWKYDWEKPYVEKTRDNIVSNTFTQIERVIRELGHGCGTRFECECYDIGHLYTLAHFLDRKLLEPPLFVQTIFGVLGGIGPHPEDLAHMRRTADRLFGADYQWSILAAGRHQMSLATMGATMGANVRVGLEDSIYLGPGQLAKSNAEQVTKIRAILENLSLEIATPAEARAMLKLKGGDQVAF